MNFCIGFSNLYRIRFARILPEAISSPKGKPPGMASILDVSRYLVFQLNRLGEQTKVLHLLFERRSLFRVHNLFQNCQNKNLYHNLSLYSKCFLPRFFKFGNGTMNYGFPRITIYGKLRLFDNFAYVVNVYAVH